MARILFEIVDSVETPLGVLDLRRRELPGHGGRIVTEILIDGDLLMSSRNPVSEQALSNSALALHAGTGGLRVYVGGLGLGYTAHAALGDARVGRVRVADRLPVVHDWLRSGQLPLSAQLNVDARFELVEQDVYAVLLGAATETYDLILIDVDHSPRKRLDEASAPFYTAEGQRRVARHLAPGGALAVWSADDDDLFAAVLEEVYPHAARERVRWEDDEFGEMEEFLFLARADAPTSSR